MSQKKRSTASNRIRLNAFIDDTSGGGGGGGGDGSSATPLDTSNAINLWTAPDVMTMRSWIAFASIILLFFDVVVIIMWVARIIPTFPSSIEYYGFAWYLIFIFTGVLTFFMSWIKNKPMFLIVTGLLLLSVIVDIFLLWAIADQFLQCYKGLIDSATCTFGLYFTQFLLFSSTFIIGVSLVMLLFLFIAILIRIAQSVNTNGSPAY